MHTGRCVYKRLERVYIGVYMYIQHGYQCIY